MTSGFMIHAISAGLDISGNDPGITDPPDTETSPDTGEDTPGTEIPPAEDDVPGAETPPDDGEDTPGTEDPPAGDDSPGTETPPGTGEDTPGTEDPPAEDEFPAEPDFMQEVLDRLASMDGSLEGSPDYTDLLESMHSLVDIMAIQAGGQSTPAIPLTGYREYRYPVTVQYRIFPTALGSGTGYTEGYDTPEAFEDGYSHMSASVSDGSLAWFSIRLVTDAEGTAVYDSEAVPEEPDTPEEPEEPDTFREDVLAALAALNDNINTVSANDLEYREQILEFQAEYMKLQQENTQFSYHLLACDIAIGFALFLMLGYTVAHGFFQRMRVG